MKYMGSKNHYAREMLSIILKDRQPHQWYVEPFVGGFNMIDKVDGKRIANDNNPYLIALFQAVVARWIPPTNVGERTYNELRDNKNAYPPHLVGFVGFGCSYSGKWFGGYARGNNKDGSPRNYCDESKRNILKQVKKLKGVQMYNLSYDKLLIPPNSLIYCDPPYANTTKYKDSFDHTNFWEWVRDLVKIGHQVFVSEYVAPDDFVCVWSKVVNNTLVKDTGSKQGIEKLWVHRDNKP